MLIDDFKKYGFIKAGGYRGDLVLINPLRMIFIAKKVGDNNKGKDYFIGKYSSLDNLEDTYSLYYGNSLSRAEDTKGCILSDGSIDDMIMFFIKEKLDKVRNRINKYDSKHR